MAIAHVYDREFESLLADQIVNNVVGLERKYRLASDNATRDRFNELRMRYGDKGLNARTVKALRAMADKLEQPGMHFMVSCDVPKLPIFSGDDDVKSYSSHISVTIVKGPLGG